MDERLIDRAVVIWKRLLGAPEYKITDDKSGEQDKHTGAMFGAMASMLPSNATPSLLDKFGDVLRVSLVEACERQGDGCYVRLSVDYGPDEILHAAATEAGLKKMPFPSKTDVYLTERSVSVSAGYRAETVYHYPFSCCRWLVTTLSGSDLTKLIDVIECAVPTGFTVERDADSAPGAFRKEDHGSDKEV